MQSRNGKLSRERSMHAIKLKAPLMMDVIEEEPRNVEENDEFDAGEFTELDTEFVIEGALCIQDLLTVMQETGLADALPQAMLLLDIAAVIPLTRVHCERVFSRMKRVVSASRSRMLQARKEHLVMLQIENGLLRWLSKQPNFYENIVKGLKRTIKDALKDFPGNDIIITIH